MLASKRLRTLFSALSITTGILIAMPSAHAQSIAAFVNGEPITSYDIEQRSRINRLARQSMGRSAVLNELIDDKVKLAEARRIGYRLSDENVDEQISRIAKSNRQSLLEFNQTLGKAGIDMNAYRQKLKANYAWELAVERRNKGNEPQDSIFTDRGGSGGRIIDYTLYSVIFVVPRGASAGSRVAEANGARARFNNCTTGLEALRNMRDVAVKLPVRRTSDTLSPQLNKILAATPVNRMTQPFPSDQGIEALAVCEKTERAGLARAGSNADSDKKKTADATSYLKSLRSKAVIQYR